MAEKRLGNQNPTQSVILPYTESLSDEAIAIYEKNRAEELPVAEKSCQVNHGC